VTATGFGFACAVLLAAVFVVAAVAKARDRRATVGSFSDLGVPRPATMAVVVPVLEVGTAAILLLVPVIGGFVALALLAFFTTFLVTRLTAGVRAPCSCFGAARRRPVSAANLVGNGFLVLLALGALGAAAPVWPTAVDLAALAAVAALEVVVHRLVLRAVGTTERAADVAPSATPTA
jgi:uncharacterized membrane protein YphA (DoxX/SURF4 family)